MSKVHWTEKEDKILLKLVAEGVDWDEISKAINRSRKGCQKRFNRINPIFKTGGWEKEEDASLILFVFSNLEERISRQQDLWADRRRSDVIKRTEFLKKLLLDKMFPEGVEPYLKEESKIWTVKKSKEKIVRAGAKRKVKMEDKESDEEEEFKQNKEKIQKFKEEDNCKKQKLKSKDKVQMQKSLTRDQFFIISDWEDVGESWSKDEENKLFELCSVLHNDWKSISKFMQGRTPESIHDHYINTLRWAAYEYKVDCD